MYAKIICGSNLKFLFSKSGSQSVKAFEQISFDALHLERFSFEILKEWNLHHLNMGAILSYHSYQASQDFSNPASYYIKQS